MRVNTAPNVYKFQADSIFTWVDLGEEIIYLDDPVLGSSKTDGVSSPAGLPLSKWNKLYEDLYNRLGYVKRQAEVIGNRGYSNQIVINASRALTIADSGLIKVITTTVGSSPSSIVELTLPTRAGLITAGIGYVEAIAISPFLNVQNAGIAPFVIEGYCTSAGVPLKISVANPTSPGSPVSGDDMAQSIKIGTFSTTTVYLFDGEYAEFIPIVLKDTATGLWYTEWHVRVHNTSYQKLVKGGGDAGVTVGAATYPTANYEKKGDYYTFNIDSLTNLCFLPDNKMGEGKIIYIKMNYSNPAISGFLVHNQSSPPSGYKPILTPAQTNHVLRQDDVLVLIEEPTAWRCIQIVGLVSNFNAVANNLSSAISTEASNRNNAIASAIASEVTNRNNAISTAVSAESIARDTAIGVETNRATIAEGLLDGRLDTIESAWVLDSDLTHWAATDTEHQRPQTATVYTKVIGKTLHVNINAYHVSVANGTITNMQYTFQGISRDLYASSFRLPCYLGGLEVIGGVQLFSAGGVFKVTFYKQDGSALGNGNSINVNCNFTINID